MSSLSRLIRALSGLVLVIASAALVEVGLTAEPGQRVGVWLGSMVLLGAVTLGLGRTVTGRWAGALIDERNKMSLSRLQMLLWTILIASGFLVAVLANLHLGQPHPLAVAIPRELWLVLAVSTTSLTASPLIQSTKQTRAADEQEKERTFTALARQQGVASVSGTTTHVGQLVINLDPSSARWSDLFTGEEVGDASILSLGKIQMFYMTWVLILAYAASLISLISDPGPISTLPDPDSGLVALLGISHLGYLSLKAIPQSRTA